MKVLFVHFRSAPSSSKKQPQPAEVCLIDSAGTDGVSLEMMKRQGILNELGHKVAICSAYNWADFPVPALEFDSEEVMRMMRNLFGPEIADFASEAEFKTAFDSSLIELKQKLRKVVEDFVPATPSDCVILTTFVFD